MSTSEQPTGTTSDADASAAAEQRLPRRFPTVQAYNAAHPNRRIPADASGRLRGYHAAMVGVEDDVAGTGYVVAVDFLPGGAPLPAEPDRLGTVVATHWGRGPVLVLAEDVPLRAAWKAITQRWPTRLSEVRAVLATVS
jgi:hypothetical protein